MRDPRHVRALLFDFNGTLLDDERLQCAIYQRLFAEHGRPLTEEQYFVELAGLSDFEIVERSLGPGHPAGRDVLAARVRLYQEAAGDGSTVAAGVRAAVLSA
jgi:beta-phosphoglucomutase-like phosphatase (HAD superfamily)